MLSASCYISQMKRASVKPGLKNCRWTTSEHCSRKWVPYSRCRKTETTHVSSPATSPSGSIPTLTFIFLIYHPRISSSSASFPTSTPHPGRTSSSWPTTLLDHLLLPCFLPWPIILAEHHLLDLPSSSASFPTSTPHPGRTSSSWPTTLVDHLLLSAFLPSTPRPGRTSSSWPTTLVDHLLLPAFLPRHLTLVEHHLLDPPPW